MKNRTVNFMLRLGVRFLFIMLLLHSHVSDGNVWGIYIEDGSLLIGDFWASCLIIILIVNIVQDSQETYS